VKEKMATLFITLLVFSFSSVAFYVSLNNYLIDQADQSTIQVQYAIHNQALRNTITLRAVEDGAMLEKRHIEALTATCNSLDVNVSLVDAQTTIDLYDSLNATIASANRSCHASLDALNRTIQQIINTSTVTPTTVGDGECQINTDLSPYGLYRSTFFYRRLTLNGVDFYYYVFPTSPIVPTNGTIVRIENCSPVIFQGPVVQQTYKLGGVAGDGVEWIFTGNGAIELVLQSGNRTVELTGFQAWGGSLF
jgi:hypothetical protein